ncbi:MAG: dual specificity protein phosphatase family protein [Methylocapsa sp.]|nr:dual specificity protein phosphatase family protein [Methylocapsa sp.]
MPTTMQQAVALAGSIIAKLKEGKAVGLHCRAGIGRSALIAACVLVLLGLDPEAAFELIERARGVNVPDTEEQRRWVATFRELAATGAIPNA